MSLPPHREKDAKVEGRDQPETVKETMAPFRSLMGRLLNVPMSEVKEQQRLYDEMRLLQHDTPKPMKLKRKRISLLATQSVSNTAGSDITKPKK